MANWDEHAEEWDRNEAVQAYAEGAFESLTSLAATTGFALTGATVCDFGCGTGLLTMRLADICARVDAVDTSAGMLEVLGTKIDRCGWKHVRSFRQLPSTPQGYDLIVCSSVLSFVDDYPGVVSNLISHLGLGGLFVQWDWELDPDDAEPHGFTRAQIRRTLEAAGLVDVNVGIEFEVTFDGHTMTPLMGSGRRSN